MISACLLTLLPEIHVAFTELEWQQRERLAAGLQPSTNQQPSQWARLSGDEIIARNRYLNVEPFASNRIKLKVATGINDYINASPVVLGSRRYIATQGPKDTSTAHFYRMIASETGDTAVIVMLTQTHDAGREKCFQYFPLTTENSPIIIKPDAEIGDGFQGTVELVSTEEDRQSRCTIRQLRMRTRKISEPATNGNAQNGGSDAVSATKNGIEDHEEEDQWTEKEIWHLLFSGWPDFLVPEGEDRDALMHLLKLSERLNARANAPKSNSFPLYGQQNGATDMTMMPSSPADLNPRIVHCSAGVGRSGTFIALDHLIRLLENGDLDHVSSAVDPIAQTVNRLREQRMMMVQGEGQFHFLYEALREAWIERWKTRTKANGPAREISHFVGALLESRLTDTYTCMVEKRWCFPRTKEVAI